MTKKKETIDWKIVVAGLMCLTAIQMFALSQGIDGTLMTLVIGIIALAIGVSIPNPIKK